MEKSVGTIIDPHTGEKAISTVLFSVEEARILREYKKILQRYAMKEALFCDHCWDKNVEHGLEAFVTDQMIAFRCRCTQRVFQGPTY